MVHRGEFVEIACRSYNILDSGITKFNDPSCFNIYEMVMLPALVSLFKLGNVFSELMLDNQITIEK